jgi:hypothetical protein
MPEGAWAAPQAVVAPEVAGVAPGGHGGRGAASEEQVPEVVSVLVPPQA